MIFGEDSLLFKKYVKGQRKIIFPWPLSIVDCFFLGNAFKANASCHVSVNLARISDSGRQIERLSVGDAYDVYDIDSDAHGAEVVLSHEETGAHCYWDLHERFVVAVGSESFLKLARPYPEDIERHRYVEAMLHIKDTGETQSPESIYEALIAS